MADKMQDFIFARAKVNKRGPIAQLARARALQARGRGFDSHWVHTKAETKSRLLSYFLLWFSDFFVFVFYCIVLKLL